MTRTGRGKSGNVSANRERGRQLARRDLPIERQDMSGIVLAAGDIAPDRDDPDECFAGTAELLRRAEIVFGQLETSFAAAGTRLPQARHAVLREPASAPTRLRAPDSTSCPSRAIIAWTGATLPSSRPSRTCRRPASAVVGAGQDIAAARGAGGAASCADGTRVAFLAYCSILPMGYWAEERRPAVRPCGRTPCTNRSRQDQPGTPPRIHSYRASR